MPIIKRENVTSDMFNQAVADMTEKEKIVPINDGANNLAEDEDSERLALERQALEKMIKDARELEIENDILSGKRPPDYHPNNKDNCFHRYGCGEQYKPKK